MDQILIGDSNTADRMFDICMKLLERILTEITNDFGDEPALKITFRAPQRSLGHLQVFVELNPPVVDDMSTDELRQRLLDEFNLQLPPTTSLGALKTKYEELCRENNSEKSYEILPLYEKAASGKLFMYTMDISHILNGKRLDHRSTVLNLKDRRASLETYYRFRAEVVSGPLSIAREYWYALKEGERDSTSTAPRLFMYK